MVGVGLACAAALAGAQPRPEPLPLPEQAGPRDPLELRVAPSAPASVQLAAPLFVRAFRIVGAGPAETAALEALLAPWTARTLDASELTLLVGRLTSALHERGLLVAQVQVPAQDAADGVLTLMVLEGRIGKVRVDAAPDLRLRAETLDAFLSGLAPGETLRRDNVERQLLLLNDLPGSRLQGNLVPGSEAGTADLALAIENEPRATGRLVLDNAGMRGLGDYRAIGEMRLPSPLGHGDQLSARVMHAFDGGRHTIASATYGIPVNGRGTRVGVRYIEQRYRIGREFDALRANGDSNAVSVLASHPLVRRSDRNLGIEASYTHVAYHDRQDAVSFTSDSRQRVASLSMTFDTRDAWLGGGVSALHAQVLSGETILETPLIALLDTGPGGLGVAGRFHVLRLRAERSQALSPDSELFVWVRAQLASKNLDPGTEMAAAGLDAVRAYPTGELYGDQGVVARIEYRRVFSVLQPRATLGRVFFDAARVDLNRDPLPGDSRNSRELSGYGVAVDQAIRGGISLHAILAWRASGGRPITAPDRDPRLWVAAQIRF
jgi:hemolysin activation/secretion protein